MSTTSVPEEAAPYLALRGGVRTLVISEESDVLGDPVLKVVNLDNGAVSMCEPEDVVHERRNEGGARGELLRLVLANRILENRGAHGISLRANVKPYNYQIRPLMKFNTIAGQRVLIADETGLGKTIEAGMIIAETVARIGPECRVLVLSPASVMPAWKKQLREKFGIRAVDTELGRVMGKIERRHDWDREFNTQVCIVSHDSLRSEWGLKVPPGSLDLLVIDEIQNFIGRAKGGTRRRECGLSLSAGSDACLGLSATPVMIERNDLQRVLSVIAPGEHGVDDFPRQASIQVSVNRFLASIRDGGSPVIDSALLDSWPPDAGVTLQGLQIDPSLENMVHASRAASRIGPIGRRMTRARARDPDVDLWLERTVKDIFVEKSRVSDDQSELIDDIDSHFQSHRGFANRLQLASCPSAIDRGVLGVELGDPGADSQEQMLLRRKGRVMANRGPKLDALVELLQQLKRRHEDGEGITKAVVFTHWIPTLTHLPEVLGAYGIEGVHALKPGKKSWKDSAGHWRETRDIERLISKFAAEDGFAVLIASDRMSEGIDLEMANVVINMDLPYNPAKIQQRIGRVDRPIIQEADFIEVYNLILSDSIEVDVYDAVRQRRGFFLEMVGGMEDITEECDTEEVTSEEAKVIIAKITKRLEEQDIAQSDELLMVVDASLDRAISEQRKALHPIHSLGHMVLTEGLGELGIVARMNPEETEMELSGSEDSWSILMGINNGFLPWEVDDLRYLLGSREAGGVKILIGGGGSSIGPMHPLVISLGRLLVSREGFLPRPVPEAPFNGSVLIGSNTGNRWSVMSGDGSTRGIGSSDLVRGIKNGSIVTGDWSRCGSWRNARVWTWLGVDA